MPKSNNQREGPRFVRYFGPLVDVLKELGGSARPAEVRDRVAAQVEVSDAEQSELLPSGTARFDNQVAWARFYLAKAGMIDSSRRGVWTLTEKGRVLPVLAHRQAMEIFRSVHAQFARDAQSIADDNLEGETEAPTEEAVAASGPNHRTEVLNLLRSLPSGGFEDFCQRILRESGFQEVTVTGRSGDGGIDGIGVLQVNPLVSFKVLFQCKRYAGSVTASHIRDFRGAMMGRADKGIILTTGSFTGDARKEAIRDGVPPIELVDGEKLVNMLEELELGLTPVRAFRVNESFFDEFKRLDTSRH